VPEKGRDLQCGSCNHAWFYKPENESESSLVLNENTFSNKEKTQIETENENIGISKKTKKEKKNKSGIKKEISKEITIIKPAIPDLGDVDEVEVIEICVEVGQKVESEDSIMILETDKAAMEIPASTNGIVKNILIKVGDMVKEGMQFVELETIINEVAQDNKQTKNEDNELAQSEKITSQENIELKKKPTQPINFKNACKSSFIILPFGPDPLTCDKSIPNSLANFLVAGPE
jgi:pyruvate dehydrogenase E2 component (dihydrolipoamide acetyltransferase)